MANDKIVKIEQTDNRIISEVKGEVRTKKGIWEVILNEI